MYSNTKKMKIIFDAEQNIRDLCTRSEIFFSPDNFPPSLTQMYERLMKRFGVYHQHLKLFYSLDDIDTILHYIPQVIRHTDSLEYESSHIEERVLLYSKTGKCLGEVSQQLVQHAGSVGTLDEKDHESLTITERGITVQNAILDLGKPVYGIVFLFFLFDELMEFSLFVNLDGSSMARAIRNNLSRDRLTLLTKRVKHPLLFWKRGQ